MAIKHQVHCFPRLSLIVKQDELPVDDAQINVRIFNAADRLSKELIASDKHAQQQ